MDILLLIILLFYSYLAYFIYSVLDMAYGNKNELNKIRSRIRKPNVEINNSL